VNLADGRERKIAGLVLQHSKLDRICCLSLRTKLHEQSGKGSARQSRPRDSSHVLSFRSHGSLNYLAPMTLSQQSMCQPSRAGLILRGGFRQMTSCLRALKGQIPVAVVTYVPMSMRTVVDALTKCRFTRQVFASRTALTPRPLQHAPSRAGSCRPRAPPPPPHRSRDEPTRPSCWRFATHRPIRLRRLRHRNPS